MTTLLFDSAQKFFGLLVRILIPVGLLLAMTACSEDSSTAPTVEASGELTEMIDGKSLSYYPSLSAISELYPESVESKWLPDGSLQIRHINAAYPARFTAYSAEIEINGQQIIIDEQVNPEKPNFMYAPYDFVYTIKDLEKMDFIIVLNGKTWNEPNYKL